MFVQTSFSWWQKYAERKRGLQIHFYDIFYLVSYRLFRHAWMKWKAMRRKRERSAQTLLLFSAVREWNLIADIMCKASNNSNRALEITSRVLVQSLLKFSRGPRARPSNMTDRCRQVYTWMESQRLKSTFFARMKTLLNRMKLLKRHENTRQKKNLSRYLCIWRRETEASRAQEFESLQVRLIEEHFTNEVDFVA